MTNQMAKGIGFCLSLCFIAFVIQFPLGVWRHSRAIEKAKAQEKARIQETRSNYLARYIDPRAVIRDSRFIVAVAAAKEDGTMNSRLADAIASKLAAPQLNFAPSIFTDEFYRDGLFARALADAPGVAAKLDLTNCVDMLILARQNVSYDTNNEMLNAVSAHMQVEIETHSLHPGLRSQRWSFNAAGVGFKPARAHDMAEQRLFERIIAATNFSLN